MTRFGREERRGKARVVGYVSPVVKEAIQELVKKGLYSTESDFVSEAVIKLVKELEVKGKIEVSSMSNK